MNLLIGSVSLGVPRQTRSQAPFIYTQSSLPALDTTLEKSLHVSIPQLHYLQNGGNNSKWIELTNQKAQSSWLHKKQDPTVCCLQETHFRSRDTQRLEVKGWKTTFQANRNKKKVAVAILKSDKIDFKPKRVIKDK